MKNSASEHRARAEAAIEMTAPPRRDPQRLIAPLCAALSLLALAACGGGGGAGPTATTAYYSGSVEGTSSSNSAGLEGGGLVLKSGEGGTYLVSSLSGSLSLSVAGSGAAPTTLSINRQPINQICSLSTVATAVGSTGPASISCVYTPINDTGLTTCRRPANCAVEDAGSGRDAQGASLTKVNAAARAGFDYTRICNNGGVEGSAGCALGPNPVPGTGQGDWGCTRDNVTGLVWLVDNYPGRYAQGEVNRQTLAARCGRPNWRIPSVEQLQSVLYNPGVTRSASYPAATVTHTVAALTDWLPMFDFVARNRAEEANEGDVYSHESKRSGFWTNSSSKENTDNAWAVQFMGSGRVVIESAELLVQLRIAPVSEDDLDERFSDPYHAHRFPSQGQAQRWELPGKSPGTLIDRRSGLMWMICSVGRSFNATAPSCAGAVGAFGFEAALTEATTVNANTARNLGFADWRIPSRAELYSLIDILQSGPAVSAEPALNVMRVDLGESPGSYWSSSWIPASGGQSDEAFAVNFNSGEVALTPMLTDPLRVRLVRSAR